MKALFYSLIALSLFAFAHPFYLSVTDLKYDVKSGKIQGTVKIFSNDLETSLRKIEKKQIDLLHPVNKTETTSVLSRYLQKRLKLKVNSKDLPYELLGFENEEESIWIYFESTSCEQPKVLEVQNSILYEEFREQINIINARVGALEKSWKLTNPEKVIEFEF